MSSNKSKLNSKYNQGKFTLNNPEKYIGNPSDIVYRSSWELAFCHYLDNNESIIKWSCEQPIITYQDLRNKVHRYYPDFYYEKLSNDVNGMVKVIVEIKPKTELYPPAKPKRETAKALENYEYAVRTHIKNNLKWSAAEEYATKRGMQFVILTEDHLVRAGLIQEKKYRK
jgi:hypothetical protein